MDLYWGDLHNHCGITYGFGSLENALTAARNQLDFCSVTPHAMWHDMPPKNEDTEFLVNFHQKGFDKIKGNWEQVKETMNRANVDGEFVTFFSFEMHSSFYGDYHMISPDQALRLVYEDSPFKVLAHQQGRCIIIPHHIGYTPGYRGINWDYFDESVSPLVEVYSKHGCAVNDRSPFPYYHDMGPRDSRNTAYQGLKRGKKFSFVGSTDHHAGFPGSYGDGKLAVLAETKSREAIWDGLVHGRTYAVTGDKIECHFSVNKGLFGSIVPFAEQRNIDFSVKACDFIDKIVIYKNLQPLYAFCGESLTSVNTSGKYKLRLELGWGNNKEAYLWDCKIHLQNGHFTNVENCFRGKSILTPSPELEADVNVNQLIAHTELCDSQLLLVECQTFRNFSTLHPQTSAVVMEIEGDLQTSLELCINGQTHRFHLDELLENSFTAQMQPYNSQAYKLHLAVPESQYCFENQLVDNYTVGNTYDCYHMEVTQKNGQMAWISPVFVKND